MKEQEEKEEENQKPIIEDPKEKEQNYQRHLKHLIDIEDHFIKLKSKVRLKSTKDFHEDVENQKELERLANIPKVEIKDKFGRVMERK